MWADCHIHTPLCGHACGDPVDYVRAAAERMVTTLTFSCHIPMEDEDGFRGRGIRMAMEDLPRYRQMVDEARQLGHSLGVDVLCGIEAEYFPDPEAMRRMSQTLRDNHFDFILGSIHHQLPIFQEFIEEQDLLDDGAIITAYFEMLAQAAESGTYHSLAHPDLIRIYNTVASFDPVDYAGPIQRALDRIAATPCCLEVNTSGLIKGVFEMHPAPVILGWARERDIPLTLGSDSHLPEQVGQFFGPVTQTLREIGYTHAHFFRNGQRQSYPLPEIGEANQEENAS